MRDFDKAISLNAIAEAEKMCLRGVRWKYTPIAYHIHYMSNNKRMRDMIVSGTYKMMKGTEVQIYRPKRRTALAIKFRDRIWHKSILNNGVYDDLIRPLIYDNGACQIGKGMDFAVGRVVCFLQKMYRESGENKGYGVHLDIAKYFPSTPKALVKYVDRSVVSDLRFIPYLDQAIDSSVDKRPYAEIQNDFFGERGIGLGSPLNQINQVALLDTLDKLIKKHCAYYERVMDDILILDNDICKIKIAIQLIEKYLLNCGFLMTNKNGIFKVSNGFYFLKLHFKVTERGKVIVRLSDKAMQNERHELRNLKKLVDSGKRTMDDVKRHYQSFISRAEICSSDSAIRATDRFYTELFRQKPIYKRSKRRSGIYGKKTSGSTS